MVDYLIIILHFYLPYMPLFVKQQRLFSDGIFQLSSQIMHQYYPSNHLSNSLVSILAMSTFNDVLSINVVGHLTVTEHSGHPADEIVHTL